MKQRIWQILLSFVLLLGALGLFHWEKQRQAAPMPEPSAWGGYYENPFVLTLSAGRDGKIYYTTDGSTPTRDSAPYQGGIPIENRSQEPNVYNAIPNIVPQWQDIPPVSAPVEKGTVIRAIFINERGIESEILTQTYFVGLQPPEQGLTLSLVFEDEDFFGEDGLYVTGKAYDDWYLSGGNAEEAPIPNFEKRIEVAAVAELLDGSGDILNQSIGVRLQGNSSRGIEKKRLILTAREEYSGSQVFGAQLYEGVTTHSVMLKDALPDAIAAELTTDRAVATQRSIPVRVYFNGEYWQDTYMLERYDKQYFRQHYDVDQRMLVKSGVMDEDSAAVAELDYYNEFLYWVGETDFSDEAQWAQVQKEADIQSYIDYIAINYYLCNYDFSQWHNYVLWRSPTSGGSPYRDMRWRWCIYDIDALFYAQYTDFPGKPSEINIFNCVFPQTDIILNQNTLFVALRRNPDYCRQFVLSFMDIGNNNFSPEQVEPVLKKYGYSLDWMENYFLERPAYAAKYLAEEFGLTGSLETVTIQTAQPEMGTVQVNTSVIDLSSGTWSGKYFTDYPITVTATPKDGYTFIGWKGASDETTSTITLSMEGSPVLEAVFEKTK